MTYNLYKKVAGHRGKYKKIFTTEDYNQILQEIDKQLFHYGVRPEDILVRKACYEADKIQGNLYGWD